VDPEYCTVMVDHKVVVAVSVAVVVGEITRMTTKFGCNRDLAAWEGELVFLEYNRVVMAWEFRVVEFDC
jgi:hypothetical protein